IALNFSPGVKTAYVNADKSALCKILNNVLLNAIKYAESHINVVLSADGGKICLKVSNDGNHIPEDQREEIFKPFVQAGTQSA
ncbi:sensor histidine kinase, partial [Salmonella enterica]|uniref:sensor histidine kinase n=1 Tax=Salmonella enterica TaxID=28901 RepID=UPI003CF85E23